MRIFDSLKSLLGITPPALLPAATEAPSSPVAIAPYKVDSWANAYTGLGTDRDKLMAGAFSPSCRIPDPELIAMYHGDDIARRVVELKPREMFRRGYELKVRKEANPLTATPKFPKAVGVKQDGPAPAGDDTEVARLLQEDGKRLDLDRFVLEAKIFGRLLGGALLIVGANDMQADLSKPLAEDRIQSIDYLTLVDKRFVVPSTYYGNPLSPNYGRVEVYRITNALGGANVPTLYIHESRCVRFDGLPVDMLERINLGGWTHPIFYPLYDTLRAFASAYQAAGNLLTDASQGVFKLNGLVDQIAAGEGDNLRTRMEIVEMGRSVARAVMLDAENEDFTRVATSFAGIPDMLDRFGNRLSAATGIPVTILMGQAPAGLNATGASDIRQFYDTVAAEQENELTPVLMRLYTLLALAKKGPCKGKVPDLEVSYRPLWQPTDLEQAQLELAIAQKDTAYIAAQVLTPEEVAISRYGAGGFSMQTTIDVQARQESLASAVKFDPYENEPPTEPVDGEPGSPVAPPPGPVDASK